MKDPFALASNELAGMAVQATNKLMGFDDMFVMRPKATT